jgi:hypothetical protein
MSGEWADPSFGEVIEAPELPVGRRVGRYELRETVFARDRVGDLGVVATIRPSGRAGWYWSWYLSQRAPDGQWHELFGNGGQWSRNPTATRSQTEGYDVTTHTGSGGGEGQLYAVTGGVVGAPVARLEVVTAVDRHFVPIDLLTGAFVMLAVTDEEGRFELIAHAGDGRVLHRWEYDPAPQPIGVPPGWELVEQETADALGVSIAYVLRELPR